MKVNYGSIFSVITVPATPSISAAGCIDQQSLIKKLRPVFEGWKQPLKPTDYHSPVFQSSVLTQNKDTEQVQICLGVPGLKQSDDRIYELYVLNNVLGGGVSSPAVSGDKRTAGSCVLGLLIPLFL